MNEAEVSGGRLMHVITDSLELLKSSVSLFMAKVLALTEMKILMTNWKIRCPSSENRLGTERQELNNKTAWRSLATCSTSLVLLAHRLALSLGHCAGTT